MPYSSIPQHLAAAVQAELRKSIVRFREMRAPTLQSFMTGAGARQIKGGLTGYEIPIWSDVNHGSTALDPYTGLTSFRPMIPATSLKMFIGLTFTGFTVSTEYYHNVDMRNGKIPLSVFELRDNVMATYMKEHNWYSIGNGTGVLAVVTTAGGTGLHAFAFDNTAKNRSKGSIRLAVSTDTNPGRRIEYDSVDPATDTVTGTFYITNKPNATQAQCTFVSGTHVAGNFIVKAGHWKRVPFGLGYHIESTPRFYQGVNTALFPFLNSRNVPAASALITPNMIDTAKGATQIRGNDPNARFQRICHISIGNYKVLASLGYTLRQYNAEGGKADTTFGLPYVYSDEDTIFLQDADMEDAWVYFRDRNSFFHYRQLELTEISNGETQFVGTFQQGSTEFYQNYGESYNLGWDGRGDDAGSGINGSVNSTVMISNLQLPPLTQVSEGFSLV